MEIKNRFPSRKSRRKRRNRNWFSTLFSFFGNGEKDGRTEKGTAVPLEPPAAPLDPPAVLLEPPAAPGEPSATDDIPIPARETAGELVPNTPDTPPKGWEKTELGDKEYTARKNAIKFTRSIFQFIVLGMVLYAFVSLSLTLNTYRPYDTQAENLTREKGFITLAYVGIQRLTTRSLFGSNQLRQHLTALKDAGYVTITQQDIIDYYTQGRSLPEKALFLIFEDGRRNTAIFSQEILEELNFKATMLGCPERFFLQDPRFLTADEMGDLEKTTFWELGTNGYRYSFINVSDRYGNYFKEMSFFEYPGIVPYLGVPQKKQNHYLTDYIREENGLPAETYEDMRERISYDYRAIADIYPKQVGSMPKLYVLMRPNTGKFGDHDDVSAVNEFWIKELFKINFNRTGSALNKPEGDIYNLTRMQPQTWWSVNHLLVRLGHDLKQDFKFVTGNPAKAAQWSILSGTAEFQEKTIILTSFPRGFSLLKLKDSDHFQDVYLTTKVLGNILGMQKIYLRADGDNGFSRFVAVCFLDNYLYITERANGVERELFQLNLNRHDGIVPWSVPEDKKRAELSELEAYMKYAPSRDRAKYYADKIKAKKREVVPTINDGAPEYVPVIGAEARGQRRLFISLNGDKISVSVDGKKAVTDLQITNTEPGGFYLESGWSGKYWADEVYDGVFEDLVITENTELKRKKGEVLFDIRPQGFEAVKAAAEAMWNNIINFFITKMI